MIETMAQAIEELSTKTESHSSCNLCKTMSIMTIEQEDLPITEPVREFKSITPVDPYHISVNPRSDIITVYQYSEPHVFNLNTQKYCIDEYLTTPHTVTILNEQIELYKNQVSKWSTNKFANRIIQDNNIKIDSSYDILYFDIETTSTDWLFPTYDNITTMLLSIQICFVKIETGAIDTLLMSLDVYERYTDIQSIKTKMGPDFEIYNVHVKLYKTMQQMAKEFLYMLQHVDK